MEGKTFEELSMHMNYGQCYKDKPIEWKPPVIPLSCKSCKSCHLSGSHQLFSCLVKAAKVDLSAIRIS